MKNQTETTFTYLSMQRKVIGIILQGTCSAEHAYLLNIVLQLYERIFTWRNNRSVAYRKAAIFLVSYKENVPLMFFHLSSCCLPLTP
jgi:hypothetical protein